MLEASHKIDGFMENILIALTEEGQQLCSISSDRNISQTSDVSDIVAVKKFFMKLLGIIYLYT